MPDENPNPITTLLETTKDGQLVQINYAEIKEQVADQVRAFLLNMMPAEAIAKVCEVSWKRLTEPRPAVKDRYNNVSTPAKPSELEELVTNIMRKNMTAMVAEWGENFRKSPEADAAVKGMLTALVDRAAKVHIESIGASIVDRVVAALPQVAPCSNPDCQRQAPLNADCPYCSRYN